MASFSDIYNKWTDKELDEYCVASPPGQKTFVPKSNIAEPQIFESSFVEDIKTAFDSMSTCKNNEQKIITLLTSNPNLLNSELDKNGTTPLMAAIKIRSVTLCEFLLNHDNIEVTKESYTLAILWYKENCGDDDILNIIRNLKKKLNEQDRQASKSPSTDREASLAPSKGGKKSILKILKNKSKKPRSKKSKRNKNKTRRTK